MSPLVGVLGAALLVTGGGALFWFGLRARDTSGVDRIRAAMDEQLPSDSREISVLAQAWATMSAATDRVGRGGSLFTWLASSLERASWPLRPGEFGLALIGGVLFTGIVGAVVSGPAGALVLGVVAGVLPVVLLRRQSNKVAEKADAQLPDVLGQLAASLRTGHSLTQAIEAAGKQLPAPLGPEFTRVVAETQVGRSLDDALVAMADRVGSTDLRWSVRAMMIQARTGGSLSEVLEILAEFMRDREEVRREVKALTADGRISAWVLGLLPFFVFGALLVISPDYLRPLASARGAVMIAGAGVLMAFGLFMIRKIVRVEV